MGSSVVAVTDHEASKIHNGLWALRCDGRIRG